MQRRDRQSPLFARMKWRELRGANWVFGAFDALFAWIEHLGRLTRYPRELSIWGVWHAIRMNWAFGAFDTLSAWIEHLGRLTSYSREWGGVNWAFGAFEIWTLADIRAALTNPGACSSSDVITSGSIKSETTMEDKLIMVVCGYPELYDTTSYFYKNRNKFRNETVAACRSPPHDANSRLLFSEFHTRMKRISRANEASKLTDWLANKRGTVGQ